MRMYVRGRDCPLSFPPSRFLPLVPILRRVRCGTTQQKRPKARQRATRSTIGVKGPTAATISGANLRRGTDPPPPRGATAVNPDERVPWTQNCWNRLTLREERKEKKTLDLGLGAALSLFLMVSRPFWWFLWLRCICLLCFRLPSSHPGLLAPLRNSICWLSLVYFLLPRRGWVQSPPCFHLAYQSCPRLEYWVRRRFGTRVHS